MTKSTSHVVWLRDVVAWIMCTRLKGPDRESESAATGTVRPRRRGEERRGAPVPRRPERGYVLRELYIERAE